MRWSLVAFLFTMQVCKLAAGDFDPHYKDKLRRNQFSEDNFSFFKDTFRVKSGRRIYGGAVTRMDMFPYMAALTDGWDRSYCSATVIKDYWVLTAGHCITKVISHVRYNTASIRKNKGKSSRILKAFKHPNYTVVEKEGRGVVALRHDIALIRTKDYIHLAVDNDYFFKRFKILNPIKVVNQTVTVLGYGMPLEKVEGGILFHANLTLTYCNRNTWLYSICGMSAADTGEAACAGDSGGPLVFQNNIIGVTSLGLMKCRKGPTNAKVYSVFTTVFNYIDIILNTIQITDDAI